MFLLFCYFRALGSAAAQGPVSLVNQPLVPPDATPGGAAFTLTVNGTGFAAGATVNWNNTSLKTVFVSPSQLTVAVPAADIAAPGTATVTVSNPGVGASSNVVYFPVAQPRSLVSFAKTPASPIEENQWGGTNPPMSMAADDFNGDGKLDLALGFSAHPYSGGARARCISFLELGTAVLRQVPSPHRSGRARSPWPWVISTAMGNPTWLS